MTYSKASHYPGSRNFTWITVSGCFGPCSGLRRGTYCDGNDRGSSIDAPEVALAIASIS